MAYLRCESCGAKALVAASRCPSCATEFHLVDARGERMALARCRGCGIMHRRDRSCHWCPPARAGRWRSPVVMQGMAAALLLASAGATTWRYGGELRGAMSRAIASVEERGATLASTGTAPSAPATVATPVPAPVPILAAAGTDSMPALALQDLQDSPPAPDSSAWTPAVARTWVNVRSDASRDGAVIGVIKPSERAMLGEPGKRSGWRQVKGAEFEGWADSRLFTADSVSSRG